MSPVGGKGHWMAYAGVNEILRKRFKIRSRQIAIRYNFFIVFWSEIDSVKLYQNEQFEKGFYRG